MERVYKGITFAKGYNKPFADFKKEFASTHVFKAIPSAEREAELKKAHQIATSKTENPETDINEIEVSQAKTVKGNGNTPRTTPKSEENN